MAKLLTLPLARITDANGDPVSGGLLYAYATGTTTPVDTYTTSALSVAHANPVVADAGGMLPAIYLATGVTYRFVAKTAAGASISGMDFDPVSAASDLITPQGYGATSTTDSATALASAAAAAVLAKSALVINGTIRVDTALTLPANLEIQGNGTLDLSNATPAANADGLSRVLQVGTGVTALPDLSADITLFGNTATFATAHGLAVNDVFVVWNPTDSSQAAYRTYYRAGDMFRVAAVVSSTQVRFYGQAQEAFASASVDCYKLNGGSFRASGVKIIPPATGIPLLLDGLVDVTLSGLRADSGAADTAIELFRCYNAGISDTTATALAGEAYPLIISNSQRVTVSATRGQYSNRHCLGLGGRDETATVPTADVVITGMIGENDQNNSVGAADIHGGCKRISYNGCHIAGGVLGGKNIAYRGCRITGLPPGVNASGMALQGSEIVGGTITVEGCHIVSAATSNTRGSHFYANLEGLPENLRIVLRNNTFENVGASAGTTFPIRLDTDATTALRTISIVIDGLEWVASAAPQALVRINGTDISTNTTLTMSNLTGNLTALYSANNTFALTITGPGSRGGAQANGDADATLTRASAETQVFSTTLTANRVLTLPAASAGVPGDRFVVYRSAGGAFTLTVNGPGALATIAQYERVVFDYVGQPAVGTWTVTQKSGGQAAAVADLTSTATSGSLPTANGSVTIANAATPTVTELLEYCVELEAKVESILSTTRASNQRAT